MTFERRLATNAAGYFANLKFSFIQQFLYPEHFLDKQPCPDHAHARLRQGPATGRDRRSVRDRVAGADAADRPVRQIGLRPVKFALCFQGFF